MMVMIPFSLVEGPWLRVFSFRSFCPSLRPMLNLQACAHRRSIRKGDHLTGQQVEAGLAAIGLDKNHGWILRVFLLVDVHECSKLFVDCSFICVYIWCFLIYVYYLWLIVVAFCWFVWMFKDFLNVCGFYVMHVQCECSYASSCLSIRSADFFSGLSYFIGCSPHFTKFGLSWHGFRFHERSIPFQSDGSMNRTVLLKRTKLLIAEQSE